MLAAYDSVLGPGFDYSNWRDQPEIHDELQPWNPERRWFGEGGEEAPFETDPAQCRHLAMFGPVGKAVMGARGGGFLRGPQFLDPVAEGKLRYMVAAPLTEGGVAMTGTAFFFEFESVEGADEALSEFRDVVDCSDFVVQTNARPSASRVSEIADSPSIGEDSYAISESSDDWFPWTRTDVVRYGDILVVQAYDYFTDENLEEYPESAAEMTAMNDKWTAALSALDKALRSLPE